eukprot:c12685_g1_i1.p1 GENE.c12685_g1_i1~~c12685_g1_i1.p1  ORF type:complete len:263 (-),score=50.43 c12685_g1_i1:55-813(-)
MSVDQAKVVKIFTIILVLFSFALCISSFVTAKQCYVKPCYEGDGQDMLWSIDGGRSFHVVFLSLVCFTQAIAAFWILFRIKFDELKYGMLVAITSILALALFTQAVYYGQQSNLLVELKDHLNGNAFYEGNKYCVGNETTCADNGHSCTWVAVYDSCQRTMYVDNKARSKFDAVTAFSVLLAVTQMTFAFMLSTWRTEFTSQFGGLPRAADTPSRVSYAPSQSQAQPQRQANDMQVEEDDSSVSYQADNLRL